MKRIKCEKCGGLITKINDSVFECNDCGTQYTADQVNGLLVEESDQIDGFLTDKKNAPQNEPVKQGKSVKLSKLQIALIVIPIVLIPILVCVGIAINDSYEAKYSEYDELMDDNGQIESLESSEAPETEAPETEAPRPETTADGKRASDFVPTFDELVEILKNNYPVMESWKHGKTVNNYKGSMHLYTDAGDMLSVINAADISLAGRFVYKQDKINFGFSYSKTGIEFDIDSYNDTEKIFNFIMTVVFKNVPDELLLTEEEMLDKVVFKEKTKLEFYVYQYTFSGITYEVSKYKDTGKPSYNIIIAE